MEKPAVATVASPTSQDREAKPERDEEDASRLGHGGRQRILGNTGGASGTCAAADEECPSKIGTPPVVTGLRAVVFAPHNVVGGVDGSVVVEITRYVCHGTGDKNALRAVGETGPEDELPQVVERT